VFAQSPLSRFNSFDFTNRTAVVSRLNAGVQRRSGGAGQHLRGGDARHKLPGSEDRDDGADGVGQDCNPTHTGELDVLHAGDVHLPAQQEVSDNDTPKRRDILAERRQPGDEQAVGTDQRKDDINSATWEDEGALAVERESLACG